MFQLFTWFRNQGFIKVYGKEENLEARYKNIFKTFDDCIFCKSYTYDYFLEKSQAFVSTNIKKSFIEMKNKLNNTRKEISKSLGAFDEDGKKIVMNLVKVSI